jgi:hypothetical protein
MTQEDLIDEIKRLPLAQRVEILAAISRTVREERQARKSRESIVSRLRGIAKPDGPPPSDEELQDDYIRYLMEKYS